MKSLWRKRTLNFWDSLSRLLLCHVFGTILTTYIHFNSVQSKIKPIKTITSLKLHKTLTASISDRIHIYTSYSVHSPSISFYPNFPFIFVLLSLLPAVHVSRYPQIRACAYSLHTKISEWYSNWAVTMRGVWLRIMKGRRYTSNKRTDTSVY